MSEGPLDNYFNEKMSAEERAYFESRGDEHAEEKVAEVFNEQITNDDNDVSEQSADESRGVQESVSESDDADEATEDDAYADEVAEDEQSDSKREAKSDRDYEKAFKTERHKRKELKEALEAQARKTQEMEAALNQIRLNIQNQAQQAQQKAQPQEPKEPAPDPDTDPLGYQQYQIKELARTVVEQNKYLTQRAEQEQRYAQEQAFKNAYAQSAKVFADQTPDFVDAYNFLVKSRLDEYVAGGFTPQEADRLLQEDEMSIASKAFNDKVNPAERIYKMAQQRGYAKTKSTDAKKPGNAKNIEDIKRGMKHAKSLKSGGGELPDKEYGIDDIDEMNFDEFDAYWAKLKASSKGR